MEQIIDNLYVGADADFEKLNGKPGWNVLRCCKEGPGGHRETLGYTTQGAPPGKDYLSAEAPNRLSLNFIDPRDPNYIQADMVRRGLAYIQDSLDRGRKILVACNQGHSRAPSTALLYLRSIGEMPGNFIQSEKKFRTLYPSYDPSVGMRAFARANWYTFQNEIEIYG